MNGAEIIEFLKGNFQTVMGSVNAVTGALFTAIFLRYNTSTTEFEKVKTGQFKELADELLSSGKMTYTEYYKSKNFLMVAKKADKYYSEIGEYNNQKNERYDFDWFIRFYEAVGNIGDDEMQDMWAKLLAGELFEPTSYSLRTIDILKNMRKKDAELFVKICTYSFMTQDGECFLPEVDEYLTYSDICYNDIMKLSEMGLIFDTTGLRLKTAIKREPQIVFKNNDLIMLMYTVNGGEVQLETLLYPFTEAGNEIASLIIYNSNNENFIQYGRILAEKNKNYVVSINKICKHEGDTIEYKTNNLIFENDNIVD